MQINKLSNYVAIKIAGEEQVNIPAGQDVEIKYHVLTDEIIICTDIGSFSFLSNSDTTINGEPLPATPDEIIALLYSDVFPNTGGGSGSGVQSIIAGTNITVDDTDPQHPIVSSAGGEGVGDWNTLANKPAVIGAGATKADARSAIDCPLLNEDGTVNVANGVNPEEATNRAQYDEIVTAIENIQLDIESINTHAAGKDLDNIFSKTNTFNDRVIITQEGGSSALTINATGDGIILNAESDGTTVASINSSGDLLIDGKIRAASIEDISSPNNARVSTASIGTNISRNIADSNPTLIIHNSNALSTGLSLRVMSSSDEVASISKEGLGDFKGGVTVPDEVYGSGWNSDLSVPAKNALYDQIETKANDDSVVKLSGNQDVDGSKTFSDLQFLQGGLASTLNDSNYQIDSTGIYIFTGSTQKSASLNPDASMVLSTVNDANKAILKSTNVTGTKNIEYSNVSGSLMTLGSDSAPATSGATGKKGTVIISGAFRYDCISDNAWVRSGVTTSF